jgi:hypothetical protein
MKQATRVLIFAAAAAGRIVINSAPGLNRNEREKQQATGMTNASGTLHTPAVGRVTG